MTLSFDEIERIIGAELPESAMRYQAWWANQSGASHSHAAAWQAAGYRVTSVTLSRTSGMVTFERAR